MRVSILVFSSTPLQRSSSTPFNGLDIIYIYFGQSNWPYLNKNYEIINLWYLRFIVPYLGNNVHNNVDWTAFDQLITILVYGKKKFPKFVHKSAKLKLYKIINIMGRGLNAQFKCAHAHKINCANYIVKGDSPFRSFFYRHNRKIQAKGHDCQGRK